MLDDSACLILHAGLLVALYHVDSLDYQSVILVVDRYYLAFIILVFAGDYTNGIANLDLTCHRVTSSKYFRRE